MSRHRFHVAWGVRRVVQSRAQSLDCGVQAVLEVHKRTGGPQSPYEFLSRDHLAGMFQQHRKNGGRLPFDSDFDSLFAELSCPRVKLEHPEVANV
jgi:hypothetical protein